MNLSKEHIDELLAILSDEDPKAVLASANTLLRLNVHLEEVRCALEALAASSGGVTKVKSLDLLDKVLDAMPKATEETTTLSDEELTKQIKEQYGC